eukprot:CAMPEP_0113606264 /NCGR_PEP_ID=MMETSP0017_2-20120614/2763_1 /TAXON_ID=2856 /ORGANISM="Cylindrotheca closterium" /LENGTH=213 /DNA_ID=CAMNT_0000514799 /DNA_START=262 /DNA_END=900 /DNA_ORIENTATION=+ /assembly_acc=CAM_ASM_000147
MTKADIPTSIKLYYYNASFWRGDTLRSALYLQGFPFENIHDKEKLDELKAKGKVPFGTFPVLELDGKILAQTPACAAFVGKLGDMYPSNDDPFAQANCDEIICGCNDVTDTTFSAFKAEDKKAAMEKDIDPKEGRLHMHLNGLNSIVCKDGSEFACGKDHGLTVADLAVFWMFSWLKGNAMLPSGFVLSFANLKKIHGNVEKNEKIQAFKKEY